MLVGRRILPSRNKRLHFWRQRLGHDLGAYTKPSSAHAAVLRRVAQEAFTLHGCLQQVQLRLQAPIRHGARAARAGFAHVVAQVRQHIKQPSSQ